MLIRFSLLPCEKTGLNLTKIGLKQFKLGINKIKKQLSSLGIETLTKKSMPEAGFEPATFRL